MHRSPPARVIVTASVASGKERSTLLTRFAVRILFASVIIDRAYQNYDRGRSELVAALAPDSVLDRFNDVSYGRTAAFHPGSAVFRAYLFPWEEEVLERYFPPPPAHILVGGAGGGREALALLELGYRVTAFEPSEALAASMAAAERDFLAVYRGAYETLPLIESLKGGPAADIDELGPFDASILGWGSFSHVRTQPGREHALESFGRVTSGPILVSFLGLYRPGRSPRSRLANLRRRLPRRAGRQPGDVFTTSMGFFHRTNEEEVESLAGRTRLEVVHARFDERDTNWPHVVLRRQGGETRS
jgi:hypothetical protein